MFKPTEHKASDNAPCCKNCQWWSPVQGINQRNVGDCVYPQSKLPEAYTRDLPALIEGSQGLDCPVWEETTNGNK